MQSQKCLPDHRLLSSMLADILKVKQTCSRKSQNRNSARTKTALIVIICLQEARRMIFTIRKCLFVKVINFRTPNHQLVLKRLHPGSTNHRKNCLF